MNRIRRFSTAIPKEYSFVEKRRSYKKEVGNLRRSFIFEHKKRVDQAVKEQQAERERVQKAKQARLAAKKELQAIRAVKIEEERRVQRETHQRLFEEKQKIREQHEQQIEQRHHLLLQSLVHQSQSWISTENMEEKLNVQQFEYALDQTRKRNWTIQARGHDSARTWLQRLQSMHPDFNHSTGTASTRATSTGTGGDSTYSAP